MNDFETRTLEYLQEIVIIQKGLLEQNKELVRKNGVLTRALGEACGVLRSAQPNRPFTNVEHFIKQAEGR